MSRSIATRSLIGLSSSIAVVIATSANAALPSPYQNMTFSIDAQSLTVGQPDSFYGIPIRGSDILTPNSAGAPGPNTPNDPPALTSPPGIFINNPPVAANPSGLNLVPGPFGVMELDALSYGRDPIDTPFPRPGQPHYVFSVDEFAIGLPGTAVRAEGALGTQEASADTFITPPKPILPIGPAPGTNFFFTDGNGIANVNPMPGVGLIEPNQPGVLSGHHGDSGDNLDALDFDTTPHDRQGPIYFSLDSNFNDPLEIPAGTPLPPNFGTAAANGFVGGDVLVGNPASAPGGAVSVYASASQLGLDLLGADTDDLDALKLWENGIDGFQVSQTPFDWLNGLTDMLLFSVRRNSAVIGTLDSIFGLPIEEGDVLTAPCAAGAILPNGIVCIGGGAPGIFTAAEWLGLATVRSGTGASWGVINPQYGLDIWADDLDALDQKVVPEPGSLALVGLGIVGLARRKLRRLF